MYNKRIEQIRSMKGVKAVSQYEGMREDTVVVTFIHKDSIIHDNLLKEAKEKYTVGTYFKSVNDGGKIRKISIFERHDNLDFYWSDHGGIENIAIRSAMGDNENGFCSNPCVYLDGRWAEIVEPLLHDEYGVPIFANMPYWWARDEDFGDYKSFTVYSGSETKEYTKVLQEYEDCKIFSSPESAQKWCDENNPKQPIYIDPETGDKFFEGDDSYWFSKNLYSINGQNIARPYFEEEENTSKLYNTREKCEIALAEFIASKYNKELKDK